MSLSIKSECILPHFQVFYILADKKELHNNELEDSGIEVKKVDNSSGVWRINLFPLFLLIFSYYFSCFCLQKEKRNIIFLLITT